MTRATRTMEEKHRLLMEQLREENLVENKKRTMLHKKQEEEKKKEQEKRETERVHEIEERLGNKLDEEMRRAEMMHNRHKEEEERVEKLRARGVEEKNRSETILERYKKEREESEKQIRWEMEIRLEQERKERLEEGRTLMAMVEKVQEEREQSLSELATRHESKMLMLKKEFEDQREGAREVYEREMESMEVKRKEEKQAMMTMTEVERKRKEEITTLEIARNEMEEEIKRIESRAREQEAIAAKKKKEEEVKEDEIQRMLQDRNGRITLLEEELKQANETNVELISTMTEATTKMGMMALESGQCRDRTEAAEAEVLELKKKEMTLVGECEKWVERVKVEEKRSDVREEEWERLRVVLGKTKEELVSAHVTNQSLAESLKLATVKEEDHDKVRARWETTRQELEEVVARIGEEKENIVLQLVDVTAMSDLRALKLEKIEKMMEQEREQRQEQEKEWQEKEETFRSELAANQERVVRMTSEREEEMAGLSLSRMTEAADVEMKRLKKEEEQKKMEEEHELRESVLEQTLSETWRVAEDMRETMRESEKRRGEMEEELCVMHLEMVVMSEERKKQRQSERELVLSRVCWSWRERFWRLEMIAMQKRLAAWNIWKRKTMIVTRGKLQGVVWCEVCGV